MGAIFFEAVRIEGLRYYSRAQVEAWPPTIPEPAAFEARAKDGRLILVAVNEADEAIAYRDLEANGHIDHLYCRPEVIGTEVELGKATARVKGVVTLDLSPATGSRLRRLGEGAMPSPLKIRRPSRALSSTP